MERGTVQPDLVAVASYQSVDQALGDAALPTGYHELLPGDCQCLAADNAVLGNLLDEESRLAASTPADCHGTASMVSAVQSEALAWRALDERNQAAAIGMELFYRLAEAEYNRDAAARSLVELDRSDALVGQLKAQGVQVKLDETELHRQRLELIDRQVQVRGTIRKLDGQLRQVLGMEADATSLLWPAADLAMTIAPLNVEAAVREGLAMRADLGMLRRLLATLHHETVPAARGGLGSLDPMLGVSPPVAGGMLLARRVQRSGNSYETHSRRAQLTDALEHQTRVATEEIRQGARDVEMRLRQIALAKETTASWQERLHQLKSRRKTNGVSAFDISAAELELIRAETQLLHLVIEWRIAEVKLKRDQGLLACECGYTLPGCASQAD